MKKFLLLVLIGLPFLGWTQEQESSVCVQNIELAQQRYDEGRIQDIQDLLQDCIDRKAYDKAQESQALRLLALSYLFLEDEVNAEATMLKLISANHEFQVNPAIDPTEFINLHEQFRYKPLFNLGIRIGANLSQPMVTDLNSSLSLTDQRPVYGTDFGFPMIGVNFEYEFYENFVLYPEIYYRAMTVSRTDTQLDEIDGIEYFSVTNSESQNWLSVPISVKYLLHLKNVPSLKFYANLGGSLDFLLSSEKPGDQSVLQLPNDPELGSTINSTNDKNRLNFGILAGAGITYKLGEGFVSLEARYVHSLTKLQKPENILNPTDPAQLNTLVQDDIYRLNHVAISLGYTLNIYIPKQLR